MRDGDLIEAKDARKLNGAAMPHVLLRARNALVGKVVRNVGYVVLDGEAWPCLVFSDGTNVMAQRDDEGNGPGVLVYSGRHADDTVVLCETSLNQ